MKQYKNREALVQDMRVLVDGIVQHYKTDFDHDLAKLEEIETAGEYADLFWMIRECGTWLVNITNNDPDGMKFVQSLYEQGYERYSTYNIMYNPELENKWAVIHLGDKLK